MMPCFSTPFYFTDRFLAVIAGATLLNSILFYIGRDTVFLPGLSAGYLVAGFGSLIFEPTSALIANIIVAAIAAGVFVSLALLARQGRSLLLWIAAGAYVIDLGLWLWLEVSDAIIWHLIGIFLLVRAGLATWRLSHHNFDRIDEHSNV